MKVAIRDSMCSQSIIDRCGPMVLDALIKIKNEIDSTICLQWCGATMPTTASAATAGDCDGSASGSGGGGWRGEIARACSNGRA